MPPKYYSDEEIAEMAKKIKVADPTKDNGSFNTFTRNEALMVLEGIGVNLSSSGKPLVKAMEEDVKNRLKYALWDSQRLDYLFPKKSFNLGKSPSLDVSTPPSWPKWSSAHPELAKAQQFMIDGFKEADRLNSYVYRHFQASAFTQAENMKGVPMNPLPDMRGAWVGAKAIMAKAALDITREGGKETPFIAYHTGSMEDHHMLVMEIIDVKQIKWPEPLKQQMPLLHSMQRIRFGHEPTGPLVPMFQSPKFPLIIVRYTYMEGLPEGGSLLLGHVREKIQNTLPKNSSPRAAMEKVQFHLGAAERVPEAHIRTFARILSSNAELIDPDYSEDLQSHWNGISRELANQTKISFFVPCLRLRWRALEEIETGQAPSIVEAKCGACGKLGAKQICSSCKSLRYCNTECQKADWTNHKTVCKFSKRLSEPESAALPPGKFYVSARCYYEFVQDSGFAVEQESVLQSGCPSPMDCPGNEYGDQRFILLTRRDMDYECLGMKGVTVFMWDRRRSLALRCGPADAKYAIDNNKPKIPFHQRGYDEYVKLVRQKGMHGETIYLWAKRIGDSLELDLRDLPNQAECTWR